METEYLNIAKEQGYTENLGDIFLNWEGVKDELMETDWKIGRGNGTKHIYIPKESEKVFEAIFPDYCERVHNDINECENDIPTINHIFISSNIKLQLPETLKYLKSINNKFNPDKYEQDLISLIDNNSSGPILKCKSKYKFVSEKGTPRAYFKDFDENGVFKTIILKVLINYSRYNICILKNPHTSEYAALWAISHDDSRKQFLEKLLECKYDTLKQPQKKKLFKEFLTLVIGLSNDSAEKYSGQYLSSQCVSKALEALGCNKNAYSIHDTIIIGKLYDEVLKTQKESVNNVYSSAVGSYYDFIRFVNGDTIVKSTFKIDQIIKTINATGLLFEKALIKRYVFSLLSKRFIILSGLSGSGKTQLAIQFANCLVENKNQVLVKPVGADWTNRDPLLGFPNLLDNKGSYCRTDVLDLFFEAKENTNKPYFLILDEMNLSHVERYFSDILSAMESGKQIDLWKKPKDSTETVPEKIERIPDNLFIIGTINVDETTYMFSPKVLDRASVIEFKITNNNIKKYLSKNDVEVKDILGKCSEMAEDFIKQSSYNIKLTLNKEQEIKDMFINLFDILEDIGAEFGYRTLKEMQRFIEVAYLLDDEFTEFKTTNRKNSKAYEEERKNSMYCKKIAEYSDYAIMQKILPKLHGSHRGLKNVLSALWEFCKIDSSDTIIMGDNFKFNEIRNKFKYPVSAEKIMRMYKNSVINGFASYAEA